MTAAADEEPSEPASIPGAVRENRPTLTRAARILLVAVLVILLLVTAAAGALVVAHSRLAGQVDRIDHVFTPLHDRPPRATGAARRALNILVLGTDRRSSEQTTGTDARADSWVPGAQRSDVTMLLHVDADRDGATLVSIPRDSWVEVPGHGMDKINAGLSYGGPTLAVATVERLTDVRIDHVAVVDWTGFSALIDAAGGISVTVPETVADTRNDVIWVRGRQHLDGRQALLYVRQRYGLPGGDLDRVRRQQAVVRGLMLASMSTVRGLEPWSIYRLLDTLTRNISVDSGWAVGEMRGLLVDLRGLSAGDLRLITAPVAGLGREGLQSVVHLDHAAGADLWRAVRDDDLDRWSDRHQPDPTLGPVP